MIKSLLNNKTENDIEPKWEKVLGSPRTIDIHPISPRNHKSAGSNRLTVNHSGLIEDKVERALLDLNEYKNNFMVEKIGYEQKIEQSNKDQRMRQTFYETNYKTTKSFFSNRPTSSKLTGQALTDGNIL